MESLLDVLKNKEWFQNISVEELSINLLSGFIIGFILKKSFKIVFFLIALFVLIFLLAKNKDMLDLGNNFIANYSDEFIGFVEKAFEGLKNLSEFVTITNGVGFMAGFFLGLKLG
jgi:uncharacterized membrane protein (Fun14 family)